jgi:hypothetical protein
MIGNVTILPGNKSNVSPNVKSNNTSHGGPAFEAIGLIGIIVSICYLTRLRRN